MMHKSKGLGRIALFSIIIIGIVVIVLAVKFALTGGAAINGNSAEAIAKCLTGKGVMMYGSQYCPHCVQQKEIFGDAFEFIDYIECTENPSFCKNLDGVPAWDISGKIYYGTKSLEELASLAGCK